MVAKETRTVKVSRDTAQRLPPSSSLLHYTPGVQDEGHFSSFLLCTQLPRCTE